MATNGFSKRLRLLSAAEYGAVFDNVQLKTSCHQFLVLAIRNHDSRSRLGMVIAKKHVSSAVQRNRIKRQIRESFRHIVKELPGLDLVVLARKDAGKLDNKQLAGKLNMLWKDMTSKCIP